jgi:CheY-like chemotaxis protein
MKILLVEDEESKRQQVIDVLVQRCGESEITEARSLNSALRLIVAERFELVILDMTMPTFDIAADEEGGRPQAYGGRELLRHMKRRQIETPVIVLTQFDRFGKEPDQRTVEELDQELSREHKNYRKVIRYNVAFDAWRADLARAVASVRGPGE